MISLTVLSITGIAVMMIHAKQWTNPARWIAIIGAFLALVSIRFDHLAILPTIQVSTIGNLWAALIIGLLLLILLLVPNRNVIHTVRNDHIALLIFSTIGAVLLTRFDHAITLLLGLEIMSIPLYVLAAQTHSKRSHEASLKYFTLGAFSSAVLTFGIALLYRSSGILEIPGMLAGDFIGQIGTVLVIAALCFKVGLVPFHYWVPDVYEGAPTSFTAFMSSVAKVAAVAALFKVTSILPANQWTDFAVWIGSASILVGSFAALKQSSVKRMLAYSSIAQAGFWVLLLNGNQFSIYFGFAYATASILLFWIYDLVESATNSHTFSGLYSYNKLLGIVAMVALVSLTGIPPLAGFFAKYSSLYTMLERHLFVPFAIGLLGSALGAYYYLKQVPLIIAIPEKSIKIAVPVPAIIAIVCAISLLVIFGLAPVF